MPVVHVLQVSKDNTQFQYSTPLDTIVPKIAMLFDHAVSKVRLQHRCPRLT